MHEKVNKLENSIRLAELDPENTLIKAGLKEDMVLCDIGAGSGVFSFAAAQISSKDIYALEISDDMIQLLKSRIAENNIQNLIIRKVETDKLPLESGFCDMAIMVTVLHEIDRKESMMQEIKRILKENGKLVVIEFHKGKTPMGAPPDHRISEEAVLELGKTNGFKFMEKILLGDNFYCLIFESCS